MTIFLRSFVSMLYVYSIVFFPFFSTVFCLFMVPRKYSSHKMSWKLFPLSFIFKKRWLRIGQSYSLLFDETLHFSSNSLESYYFERSLIMSLISLTVIVLFRLCISSWWDLAGFDLQEIVPTCLSCQIYIVELFQPDNGHC